MSRDSLFSGAPRRFGAAFALLFGVCSAFAAACADESMPNSGLGAGLQDGGLAGAAGADGGLGGASGSAGTGPDAGMGSGGTSGAGGATTPGTNTTSAPIAAAAGGEVRLGAARVTIPPGALEADTTITLSLVTNPNVPDATSVVGAIYDFGPSGLTFNKPVTLSLPLNQAIPAGKRAEIGWLDEQDGQWVALDSTTGADAVVAETDHFTLFAVRFVPEGEEISGTILLPGSASVVKIFEIDLDGGTVASRVSGRSAFPTQDGKIVVDTNNLSEMNIDGTGVRPIVVHDVTIKTPSAHDDAHYAPVVSPDDKLIAYVGIDDSIWVVERSTGIVAATFPAGGVTSGWERPTWTPDGRIVAAGLFGNPGLYISDVALTKLTRFDPNLDRPRWPCVSPDGTQVAFQLASHISLMNLDGTNLRQVTTSTYNETQPFFSPDGKWLGMYGNFSVLVLPLSAPLPLDVKDPRVIDILKRHPGATSHNTGYAPAWF
jgi:WD40-like Beta Propeller Repeat/ZU5 domain